ncbi:hypothetical protein D3C72_1103790 [compost metagenome]
MIQHAHREDGIKRVQGRELLNAQRQNVCALIVAQQFAHRFKLAQKQLHRIDTDRQMCPGANHAPQVIATPAAHIQNSATGQIRQMGQNAIPLPVRTPFGINVQTIKREGAFTPWHQIAHQLFKTQQLAFAQWLGAFSRHAVQQIQFVGRHVRQKLNGIAPLLKLTVQRVTLPGGHLCRQGFQPVGEMVFGDKLVEITEVDHALSPFSATREPKLKHWNHSSLCSKPALCRRALCASTESVSITFSSMLRF